MIRKSMPSGHDPMGGYRFFLGTNAKRLPGGHAQQKDIERDDDSKKSHPALGPRWRDFRGEVPARAVPSAVHGRAWTKNRENNPMQSRVNPGSQHSCCAASGREK